MIYSDMSHHLMETLTSARHVERNLKKNCIPCQGGCNMLEVSELPKELEISEDLTGSS